MTECSFLKKYVDIQLILNSNIVLKKYHPVLHTSLKGYVLGHHVYCVQV